MALAEGPGNVLYVADWPNKRVIKVANGQASNFAGSGAYGSTPDGTPASQASFETPTGVAADSQGDVFVADDSGNRIYEITPDRLVHTVVGTGFGSYTCYDQPAPATQESSGGAKWVALSPSGQLYFADSKYCIRTLDPATGKVRTVWSANYPYPNINGLAFDHQGNLYASMNSAVYKWAGASGNPVVVAGNPSQYGYSGDGGPATQALLSGPQNIAFDSRDDMFFADYGLSGTVNTIREVTPDQTISTIAGQGGRGELGTGPLPGPQGSIEAPVGVAVDSANYLFIGTALLNNPGTQLLLARPDSSGTVSSSSWVFSALVGPDVAGEETGGCDASEHCPQVGKGEPVNVATGDFYSRETDLSIPGRGIALALSRAYDAFAASSGAAPGPLGYGWALSYGMSLSQSPYTGDVTVSQEDGAQVLFVPNGNSYVSPARVLATLVQNSDGSWTFTRKAREKFTFNPGGQLTQIKDLNGYATTLAYDGQARLASVTDPADRALTFSYDGSNRIIQVSDPAGRSVHYGYDSAGNLATVTDLDGGTTTYGYDANHRLTSITDPRGHVVLMNSYDTTGRVAWQTDGLSRKTTFSYTPGETTTTSPAGNVTEDVFNGATLAEEIRGVGTPEQATWQYQYDPTTFGVSAIADPNGHTTRKTYNSAGDVLTSTDALNHETSYTYDSLNDVTSVTDPIGTTTTSTYDSSGNLLSVSTPLSGTDQTQTTTCTYGDSSHPGDVTKTTDPDGNATILAYDQYGDLDGTTDPAGDTTTFTYDQVGRRTSSVAPAGNASGANPSDFTITYTYDAAGNLLTTTDPLGHETTNTYDADQNIATSTDADGNTTSYTYDNANQQTTVTRADDSTLTKTYDADGNVATQTDGAGHTTAYTYDALDRRTTATDPLSRLTSYTYDAAGNRTSVTDAKGRTTTYGYDAANRLTSIGYSDGQTPNVTHGYDNDDQRTSMTDRTGASSYSYDSLHHLTSSTDGAGHTVGYGYDLAGNETSITYPNQKTVTRTFDQANRLASVKDWLGNTTSFAYDPDSNLSSTDFPASTGNRDSYGYNAADELTSVNMTQGQSTLATLAYTRDPLGQATTETQTGLPGPATTSYSYTKLNQLASAGANDYSYDDAGNVTKLDGSAGYTYDQADQLTSSPSATYAYDQLGERTTSTPTGGNPTDYSYDQAGQLTTYTPPNGPATTFAYDGDGLRTSKATGTSVSSFIWNQTTSVPLVLTDGQNSYIYGPDERPTEQINAAGTPSYLHHDQLGSTRLITDASGGAVGGFSYAPYGTLLASAGASSSALGYESEYTDTETGLIYLRARYYDPSTGQFLTRDPLEQVTDQAYNYADDDPVNNTDPSGLLCVGSICLGFHPMAGADALVNFGRGASWGLSDRIANLLSPGASCTISPNWIDQFLGRAASVVGYQAALRTLLKFAAETAGATGEAPTIAEGNAEHIFRDAPGHLADDTPENRTLIESVVKPENYVRTGGGGEDLYRETLPNGTQVWAKVYDGAITNGGVNQTPLQ